MSIQMRLHTRQRMSDTSTSSHMPRGVLAHGRRITASAAECTCQPLTAGVSRRNSDAEETELLVARDLYESLRSALEQHPGRRRAFGLLMLHVFQYEVSPTGGRRRRYHTSPGILDQVLANVQRVIRIDDIMLIHARTGAAVIFPDVDQQGIERILERVYASLDLLQGETLQPPLIREMVIQLGIGTCCPPASSVDKLLAQAGQVARSLVLQPALTRQLHGVKPIPTSIPSDDRAAAARPPAAPYLQLPEKVAAHLTTLLPYKLAQELRCVPVGRQQQMLTVALADPANAEHIQRLRAATGLTIFPVACDEDGLNRLLAHRW